MFLDAYKRNWLETEGYSFEDKMIDDLSVSLDHISSEKSSSRNRLSVFTDAHVICCASLRKPWRKRRKKKRRRRGSLTPFTS